MFLPGVVRLALVAAGVSSSWSWAGHPVGEVAVPDGDAFWAFRPAGAVEVPAVPDADGWGRNEIDRFVLARLEAEGLRPAPRADKRTLLRRATFDLTGLPPTPGQIDEFLADAEEGAFGRLVERLLASEAYGERWGRHWLDLARYADTSGDATDMPVPEAIRYRDYVIEAFNEDLPYDQFIVEQIAGDRLNAEDPDHERWEQRVVATGFVAMAQRFGNSKFAEMHLVIENTLDTIGKSMLGMTMTCARCHDHKFDPVSMEDYYGLYGYFEGTRFPHAGTEHARYRENFVPLERDPAKREALEAWEKRVAELEEVLKKAEEASSKDEDDVALREARDAARREVELARAKVPDADRREAWAVVDGESVGDACIQKAGDPGSKGEIVKRGFLRAITGGAADVPEGASGRLALARWIASPENPLTSRVMANRVWQWHFGRGMVATSSLFGAQGDPPSHPALLDWLAQRFVEQGWSLKALHRLILGSATWQQSSTGEAETVAADPDNVWLGRFPRRRLEGEAVRDAMLLVSGRLEHGSGGPHPFPADAHAKFSQGNPFRDDYRNKRRTVYQMVRRAGKDDFWELFDAPDRNVSTSVRRVSTVPMQALYLMNSDFVRESAEAFARRLEEEVGASAEPRVRRAFQLAFGREARDDEVAESVAYVGNLGGEGAAWTSFCRALLASNEFVYVD